jgi:hypothetical protein
VKKCWHPIRVETKIFLFAFSPKLTKIAKIFAKVFAKMQNLLFSPHILIFWEHFYQLFYFKMPTLVNSIQSDAPFPKYSTSIIIPLLASIFVKKFSRKFLHLRENFRIFAKIFAKMKFSFGPNDSWILTLPHICLFYPPKIRCYDKKLHHMYHSCSITVKFNGFFVFAKRNLAKIVSF